MSVIESIHADHGATFGERGGRTVVEHYGRPERTHRAVRNGVGLLEAAYGVIVVEGEDRLEYVDNVVSNRVPDEDGRGCEALVLDPQGRVEVEVTIYNAGERLLLVTQPGAAGDLADDWSEKVFIQDVEITDATDEYAVFRICGPQATEKVASVLNGAATPEQAHTFVRGTMGDAGVTVIRTADYPGEETYEIVCSADDAEHVHDVLLTQGMNAAPFGYQTWEALCLEAGTPLFETELEGQIPNVLGLRSAVDFEKGCFVGQEVVSRVENVGQPSRRLIGLTLEAQADGSDAGGDGAAVDDGDENAMPVPDAGATVFDGDATVGEVTRAIESPMLEAVIALALVEYDCDAESLSVRVDGDEVSARRTALPFFEGSAHSGRLPRYDAAD